MYAIRSYYGQLVPPGEKVYLHAKRRDGKRHFGRKPDHVFFGRDYGQSAGGRPNRFEVGRPVRMVIPESEEFADEETGSPEGVFELLVPSDTRNNFV